MRLISQSRRSFRSAGLLRKFSPLLAWLAAGLPAGSSPMGAGEELETAALRLSEVDGTVVVEVHEKLFTRYRPDLADRPFFFPILLDGRLPLTRGWPVDPGPDDEPDHRHHRGLWFTHGAVNGLDFWTEGKGPRIVQDSLLLHADGFTTTNRWEDPDGGPVCRDRRTHRFAVVSHGVLLDFEVEIFADGSPVVFGDTKEGTMAIRLAPTLRVTGPVAQGTIETSTGLRDAETWGKRAAWVDYRGPVAGEPVGVAIFDHPDNPRHPTWWHVRTYGLFAANPFGLHDFEKAPQGAGDLIVAAGESVRFRYRFYFHHGDAETSGVAAQYEAYSGSPR